MTGHPKQSVMRPVGHPNSEYRVREHLIETEIDALLGALKRNRHGQRDWLIALMIYRHGLRVSEACDLSISLRGPSTSEGSRDHATVRTTLSVMS